MRSLILDYWEAKVVLDYWEAERVFPELCAAASSDAFFQCLCQSGG